jgi:predicted RNA-binding protein with RPS1 domain
MNNIKEFPVYIYGKLEKFSDTISKARCRIFYTGLNRNGSYITEEFAESLLKTIPYAPVKGIYAGDDYTDHGVVRDQGRIYGIVPENPNLAWETVVDPDGELRKYATVDVLIYTSLYEEANEIVGKSQSMELFPPSIKGEWEFIQGRRVFKYSEGSFLGLQVLGDGVEPCFEGAAFFSLYESLYQKYQDFLEGQENKGGQQEMNFKLSDSQKHELLWTALNPNYTEEAGFVCEYAICDVFDEYALCYKYEDGCYERVYYTKDNEADTVTIGEKVKVFILDITESEKQSLDTIRALNNDTYEKIDEVFSKNSEFEQKIEEQVETISTLTSEKEQFSADLDAAKAQIETLTAENAALIEFKEAAELAEKEQVIDSYSKLLPEEILSVYRNEKIAEFTATELDKELAYELKKTNFSAFSNNGEGLIPKDVPLQGIEGILSKYKK